MLGADLYRPALSPAARHFTLSAVAGANPKPHLDRMSLAHFLRAFTAAAEDAA